MFSYRKGGRTMSWNWKEEIEKKEYETKGTVTISTEEYRDLIAMNYELQQRGQKEHDDWYKEYKRASELEGSNKKLQEKLDLLDEFLSEHLAVKEDYNNFIMRKKVEQLDDE